MTSSISNTLSRWPTDRLLLWLLRSTAVVAGAIVLLIVGFLVVEALPVLRHVGIARFFTDPSWHPAEGLYNLTPMLWGTLFAMVGSVLIATLLGILSAVFCHYYAPLPEADRAARGYSIRGLWILGPRGARPADRIDPSAWAEPAGRNHHPHAHDSPHHRLNGGR